jgi:hypothetical protein
MKFAPLLLIAATLLLAGCPQSTPPPAASASAPAEATAPAPPEMPPGTDPAAPMPDAVTDPDAPLPPPPEPSDAGANDTAPAAMHPSIAVGEPNPGAPGVVDQGCRTDADCAIKDVGSCCGYAPACVNKASPTFPEQVQALCAREGRVSTCGFPAITGCKCTAGKCEGTGSDADPRNRVQ